MAKPTQSILPVENGKLITNLDCNNLQLINLDESNLAGGGGSGNDTGTTTAILKGDGSHGFADAISDQDYASVGSVQLRELSANHDADLAVVNTEISTLNTAVVGISGDVAGKADLTYVDAQLAAKADDADLTAYIASNDAEVALKAYSTDVTSALSFKADTSLVTTGLALKEPLLPASPADGYILSRDLDQSWHFVDPISLGGGGGGGGGTGTVTSVGVNNGVTDLFSSSVSNASSSAVINLVASTTVGANRFYGNFTAFTGAAGFGTAAVARTSLGGTTVGQAIFQLTNPSAISYVRINADNSVNTRTPTQTLGDIGAESALTFSAPLTRTVNTVAMPPVSFTPTPRDGYLTSGDYNSFQSKIGPSTLIIATAPITFDGVSGAPGLNLIANRTIAMPSSTGNVDGSSQRDGYLTGADHTLFANKPPNSRTLAVTAPLTLSPGTVSGNTTTGDLSANRTVAIPKATSTVDGYLAAADFLRFNLGGGSSLNVSQGSPAGTATIDPAAVPPITKVYLTSQLAQNLNIILPSAASYATNNLSIEVIDVVTGGAAPGAIVVTVSRSGSDTVDGLTTPITLAEGTTYTRFFPNAAGRWFSTKYFVDAFKDPTDATRKVAVSFDNWSTRPTGTNRTLRFPPDFDSTAVVPTTGVAGSGGTGEVLRTLNANGVLSSSRLTQTEIIPTESQITDSLDHTISNLGDVDTIKIAAALSRSPTYIFPDAAVYSSGEKIYLYNSVAPSITQTVHVTTTAGNSFNGVGNNSIDLSVDPAIGSGFIYRVFISDGTSNWSVTTFGGSTGSGLTIDPWHAVTPASGVATINVLPNIIQAHHTVSMTGAITLSMTGTIPNGMTGRIKFRDTTGAHVVTTPINGVGKTPNAGGTGVFTTSTGTNIEDEYGWDFDGQNYNFFPLGLNMTASALSSFITQADIGPATSSNSTENSRQVLRRYLACSFTACGGSFPTCLTAGTTYIVGKADLRLSKTLLPANQLFVAIYSDSGTDRPSTQIGPASNAVLASTLLTSEGTVTFNGLNTTLTAGTKYWVVYFSDVAPRTVTDGVTTITSTTVTSPLVGNFSAADVGNTITGTGIPNNTTISIVNSSTNITISAAATATGNPVTLTIGDGNNNNYTRWYSAASTGPTLVSKGTSGNWSVTNANRQYLFTLYK